MEPRPSVIRTAAMYVVVRMSADSAASSAKTSEAAINTTVTNNALANRVNKSDKKWLRKSEQGDKWNRCLIEGMIVPWETGARDEQTTPP